MKSLLIWYSFLISISISTKAQLPYCEKLIVITIDGVRWQEVYEGANQMLLQNPSFTPVDHFSKINFCKITPDQNRAALMPFFWNFIANNGQLYGNRNAGNPMQVKNRYRFSYAGYNELFTGFADKSIIGNKPKLNKNITVFEYLNSFKKNKDSIAVFTSWNLFPFIFNANRSKIPINCGSINNIADSTSAALLADANSSRIAYVQSQTRSDYTTFMAAKDYLKKNHPKIMHIGFGEADEFAHHKNYADYLNNIHQIDSYIADLWQTVQEDDLYNGKTIFIITTDHGRGAKSSNWNKHGTLTKGSNQTWMAVFGNCIKPEGVVKTKQTIYNAQIAETIANLFGEKFVQPRSYSNSLVSMLQ